MTRVSIDPLAVRDAGLTAIHAADDLQAHAIALQSVILPAMPGAMAAQAHAGVGAVVARLVNAVQTLERAGAELQLRADAAEAADSGAGAALSAGSTLASAVVTSTVVLTGGVQQVSTITVGKGGATATGGLDGLRVTIPELTRAPGSDVLTVAPADPPDPHGTAAAEPAATREIEPARPIEGSPAAAVQQAVGGPVGGAASVPAGEVGSAAADGLSGGGGAGFEAGDTITAGDEVDPSAANAGVHGVGHQQTGLPVPIEQPDHHEATRQNWACWMAGSAAQDGVPPELPVMLALAGSGVRNIDAGGQGVGLFGIDPRRSYAPPGHGLPSDAQPNPEWWTDHPGAQLDEVVSRLRGAGGGIRDAHLDDPGALSRWASEALPGVDLEHLSGAHDAAAALVSNCKHAAAPGGAGGDGARGVGGGSALSVARSQLGVHEVGTNAGPKVDAYLRSAGVGSGNPWCASFVTWALERVGIDMPGQGWAAVTNWVHAAEQGQHGLQVVDAAHARPGDIVAYDWGHGSDFSGDGHIGFLDSKVSSDGSFVAVEGNAQDAVTRMDRSLSMANVVFIRAGG
jgi:CHAP domain